MLPRIVLVFVLVAGTTAAFSAATDFARVPGLTLPAPEGFCALDPQQPADARMIDALNGMLAGAQISLLGMSAHCGQLEAWRTGKQLLEDFAQYQTPTFASKSNSSRSEWVKARCAKRRAEGEKTLPGMTEDVNARAETARVQARINEMTALGVLWEDAGACYTGMVQKILSEAGGEKTQLSVSAGTIVKGRVVNYILYTDDRDADSLSAALARHKRNIAALLAANDG